MNYYDLAVKEEVNLTVKWSLQFWELIISEADQRLHKISVADLRRLLDSTQTS